MGSFKTTTRNQFDPLTEKIISGLYDYGTELYEKGPTQFTGDLTQGMSDLGKNVLEQYSALSFGQPEYTQSMDVYKDIMSMTPEDLAARRGQYAEEYSGAVLDPAMRALERRQGIDRSVEAGQMTKALGSAGFGASRRGVAESEFDLARDIARGELAAGISADAMRFGTERLASDLGLRSGAAASLADTAGSSLASTLSGLTSTMTAAELEREIGQQGLDRLLAEFQYQRDYPLAVLSTLMGTPTGAGAAGTTTEKKPVWAALLEAGGQVAAASAGKPTGAPTPT